MDGILTSLLCDSQQQQQQHQMKATALELHSFV